MTFHNRPAQRYSLLHPLFMAFFSKSLYRDVGQTWKGHGLVFLFSAVALCTIPFVLLFQSDMAALLNQEAPKIVTQMPSLRITKGKVSIDRREPYIVKDDKSGNPLIIFDTTGQISSLAGSKAVMLVSEKAVLVKNSEGQTRTIDLSEIDSFYFDRRLLYEWIDELEKSFVFILYPCAVFFFFIFRLLEAASFAAVAYLLRKPSGPSLDYGAYMRLAAIALTPTMAIGALLNVVRIVIPFWWLTSLPLTAGYLIFAVRANRIAD
jgi:uncharacterized protein DUF1189